MANIYKGWHYYMLGEDKIKYNNIYIFTNIKVFISYHKYF